MIDDAFDLLTRHGTGNQETLAYTQTMGWLDGDDGKLHTLFGYFLFYLSLLGCQQFFVLYFLSSALFRFCSLFFISLMPVSQYGS